MSSRSTLRAAVLTAVAAGAFLVPSTAALADDRKPTPTAESTTTPRPVDEAEQAPEEADRAPSAAPTASVPTGQLPRGGVAAGERAAGETGGAAMLIPAIFDDRAASPSRVPSHSGQVVKVTAR
ncbi:hypothetical protein, partial [Streptomyces clavifer]